MRSRGQTLNNGEKSARSEYQRFIQQAFESEIRTPWDQFEGGSVLGDEQFREKVAKQISGKASALMTTDLKQRKEAVRRLAEKEAIPWQAWLRVFHGGENRIAVAHSLGYEDGSAITHILKRLETRCKEESAEEKHAALLIEKLISLSSFKV